jgi:hypothetical protein
MSEPAYYRAIVIGDDIKRVHAFVVCLKTRTGYKVPVNPSDDVPDYYTTVKCPADGTIEGPVRTTLAQLRRQSHAGLPPVRLKWKSNQRIPVATLTHWCDGGECGKCSPRDLREIARSGDAGFAGQLKWVSKQEFPDLHIVCSFLAFDSWLVGWHLLKAGKIWQGGAWQRPNLKHNRRYIAIAERWTGGTPGGDQLLSDWDSQYGWDEPEAAIPPSQ